MILLSMMYGTLALCNTQNFYGRQLKGQVKELSNQFHQLVLNVYRLNAEKS